MSVAIVTDTTAYLPDEILLKQGIERISLYVNRGERSDRESDINLDKFYQDLKVADEMPTTSQPSVGDFIETYSPLLEEGHEIASVHISGGISGTCESALKAIAQLEKEGISSDRIAVIDSNSAGAGLGMLALVASKIAQNGASLKEVEKGVMKTRESLKLWFAVDTLEYLRRGGRIGTASAWIGTTLKIKPILTFENEVTPVERVRTSKRAFERLLDFAKQRKESGAEAWVAQHIQAPDAVEGLVTEVGKIMGCDPIFVSEVGPVVGTHIGPGLLGFGSVESKLLKPL